MNNILKNVLIFTGGASIGALVAAIVTKKKFEETYQVVYEDKGEKETISIYDGNGNVIDEVSPDSAFANDETTSTEEYEEEEEVEIPPEYEKLTRRYNYSEQAKEEYLKHEKISIESKKGADGPYVISPEEFSEGMDHYDKITLYYYEDDDTLTDAEDQVITDENSIVGECLTKFGEESEDPEAVFVRNDKLSIDYEVIRLSKSYSETVLGYPSEKERPTRRGRADD